MELVSKQLGQLAFKSLLTVIPLGLCHILSEGTLVTLTTLNMNSVGRWTLGVNYGDLPGWRSIFV